MIRKTLHYFLWSTLFLGALARFIDLGAASLTEAEAGFALSALDGASFSRVSQSGLYQNITHWLFFVFTDSNFLARLLVSAAGVFLIFAPFLFVNQIGKNRALIWAGLVAISPLMAASARNINSITLTLAVAVLGIWAIINEKKLAAGVALGAIAFAGPEFWLLLAIGLSVWFLDKGAIFSKGFRTSVKKIFAGAEQRSDFWIGLAAGVLIFGAGFFQNPLGLSSFYTSAADLFASFAKFSLFGLLVNVSALFIYEPLLILGLILGYILKSTALRSKNFAYLIAAVWIISILRTEHLLAISAVSYGLAFVVSGGFAELLDAELEFPNEIALMALFALVVFVFAGFNVLSSLTVGLPQDQVTARIVIAIFAVLLLALSTGLVAAGWTRQIAVLGTVIGLLIFSFLLNTAVFSKASGLNAQPTQELWQLSDPSVRADAIVGPIDRVNKWNHRSAIDTMIEIVGTRSNALLWALREYDVREITDMKLSEGGTPFVVTDKDIEMNLLQGDYRGQNSVWSAKAAVDTQAMSIARWLVFRNATINKQQIILWTNSDQFVDSQNQTAE